MALQDKLTLLSGATTTGSGVALGSYGYYNWTVYGTWNGASAQLQWSPNDGTTWVNVDGAVLTADGGYSDIPLASGQVRVAVTGTATSINSDVRRVH